MAEVHIPDVFNKIEDKELPQAFQDIEFSILLKRADDAPDRWLSILLEKDMMAVGDSPDNAMRNFMHHFMGEISAGLQYGKGGVNDPFSSVKQSPLEYWDEFMFARPFEYSVSKDYIESLKLYNPNNNEVLLNFPSNKFHVRIKED